MNLGASAFFGALLFLLLCIAAPSCPSEEDAAVDFGMALLAGLCLFGGLALA